MHTRTSRSVAVSLKMLQIEGSLLKQQRGTWVASPGHGIRLPAFQGVSCERERWRTLSQRFPWLVPAILGCVALAVRLPNLAHVAELDELYHFFAAQSWLVEGQLKIADGVYNRTALFTIFVAQWLGLLGENLVVARLPSLVAGVALVVLVFLWTRAVAGTLAAVIAALLLALDPEHLNVSQLIRFYSWHCLLFWLGAVGTYRLGTSPPPTLGGSMLLAMGVVVCFAAALYLQLTTLIGLLGVAIGGAVALGLPWLAKSSHRTRWGVAVGVALLGAVAISALIKTGLAGQLLDRYRSTPLFGAENRDAFWYYHSYLIIYYPTLWSLLAPAVVIGLAYRPRPTAFCACLVAVAFVAHSFAGPKGMRYFTYALPFLFVLWGIALAEVWTRLRRFLEEASARALAWLGLGRLGAPGTFALLATVLVFTIAANGAWLRTAANVFDFVIPPMKRQPDWTAARDTLAPWLADAAVVVTTNELSALYYLGRYDVLISKSRLSEYGDGDDFSLDPRTGRPVIGTAESLALILNCYPEGLIVADDSRWNNRAQVSDAVIRLVESRAEELELPAAAMRAYVWRQPDDGLRSEACARLPADMADDVTTGSERTRAP